MQKKLSPSYTDMNLCKLPGGSLAEPNQDQTMRLKYHHLSRHQNFQNIEAVRVDLVHGALKDLFLSAEHLSLESSNLVRAVFNHHFFFIVVITVIFDILVRSI